MFIYRERSLNNNTLYFIFFFMACVIGVIIGLITPLQEILPFLQILSNISFKIIVYFTFPYLFFSLLISTYEFNNTKQLQYIAWKIAKTGMALLSIITCIAMIIFQFIPNQNVIPLVTQRESILPITITSIVNNLFSLNLVVPTYASQIYIAPFFILAIILGINAKNIIDAHHPLLKVCSGLRSINLKVLEIIFPIYAISVLIMTTHNVFLTRTITHIENIRILLLSLVVIAVVLIFIVYPLLFKYKHININYITWCKQIIPAISTSFAGGNMTSAVTSLLYVEDISNPQHKATDITIALSFVFARVGTAVTIALSYIMIGKIYTAIPISALQFITILVISILISFISNAVPSPIIFAAIATMAQVPAITMFQDLYLSILPLSIFLHGISAVINSGTCGFMQLYIAHTIEKDKTRRFEFTEQHTPTTENDV